MAYMLQFSLLNLSSFRGGLKLLTLVSCKLRIFFRFERFLFRPVIQISVETRRSILLSYGFFIKKWINLTCVQKVENKRPTWCHSLFYFTSYVLNMFRTLIYPSSGACDYSVELPHCSYCCWFDVCWSFGVVGLEWYPCSRLKPATRIPLQPNHTETPTHIEPRIIRPM